MRTKNTTSPVKIILSSFSFLLVCMFFFSFAAKAGAQTFVELQAQIQNLLDTIAELQAQVTVLKGSSDAESSSKET